MSGRRVRSTTRTRRTRREKRTSAFEDGKLIIEAHKEDYEGANYTSGRVHTDGKGDFLYGRFEVRAKLPQGIGIWPAIWMLPSDPFNIRDHVRRR